MRDQYQTVSDDDIPLQDAAVERPGHSLAPMAAPSAHKEDGWNPGYKGPSTSAEVSRMSPNPMQRTNNNNRADDEIWVRQDITLQYGEAK